MKLSTLDGPAAFNYCMQCSTFTCSLHWMRIRLCILRNNLLIQQSKDESILFVHRTKYVKFMDFCQGKSLVYAWQNHQRSFSLSRQIMCISNKLWMTRAKHNLLILCNHKANVVRMRKYLDTVMNMNKRWFTKAIELDCYSNRCVLLTIKVS